MLLLTGLQTLPFPCEYIPSATLPSLLLLVLIYQPNHIAFTTTPCLCSRANRAGQIVWSMHDAAHGVGHIVWVIFGVGLFYYSFIASRQVSPCRCVPSDLCCLNQSPPPAHVNHILNVNADTYVRAEPCVRACTCTHSFFRQTPSLSSRVIAYFIHRTSAGMMH